MNYLTHYLIDQKEGKPNYNFGLALPDLINISKRGWRPVNHNFPVADKNINDIWEGFQQHYAADAKFHNSEIFDANTRRIRLELEKAGLNQPGIKLFFVAHVMLEMMIDRHIILTRATIAQQFYADLEMVSNEDIHGFFHASGHPVPDRFFEFFNRFKESKYLYRYADDEGIFFALNRLLKRTGQPEFEPEREKPLNELVKKEEKGMASEIEAFLVETTKN